MVVWGGGWVYLFFWGWVLLFLDSKKLAIVPVFHYTAEVIIGVAPKSLAAGLRR